MTESNLIIIVIAIVLIVFIIAQAVIRWRETGNFADAWKYAFDAISNNQTIKQGAEAVIGRLDDKGKKAVDNLLNTLDPLTDFVPGNWDQNTIDFFKTLLAKTGYTTAGGSYVDEARRLNLPPSPNPTPNPSPAGGEGSKPVIKMIRQELDKPVNKNPKLIVSASGMGNWGGEDKRAKDTPDGYSLAWQPYMVGDNFSPPPEIHRRDDGLDIAMSHRRGRLFAHQDVGTMVQPGQRYLLAVRCQCDLKLKTDAQIKGAIAIRAQLLNGEAVIRNLNAWSPEVVEDLSGGFEAMWAIEAGRVYENLSYQVLVEVGNIHAVPFDDLSKIVITAIELIPVAADYGNENLVRF